MVDVFKPLVAYKVVDLDGRLNLNAHGSLVQAKDDYFISQQIHNSDLPRGQGYGPPEISFAGIVFNDDLKSRCQSSLPRRQSDIRKISILDGRSVRPERDARILQ